jgi:hypothetical protein
LKLSFVGIVMVKKDSDIGTENFFAEMKRDKFVEHKEKKKIFIVVVVEKANFEQILEI